jgi:septum formation inhibitor-activating ATPase MinD
VLEANLFSKCCASSFYLPFCITATTSIIMPAGLAAVKHNPSSLREVTNDASVVCCPAGTEPAAAAAAAAAVKVATGESSPGVSSVTDEPDAEVGSNSKARHQNYS